MSPVLILSLIATVVITTLIVLGARWIEKNKETHPEIYKNRGIIAGVIFFILNSGDFK